MYIYIHVYYTAITTVLQWYYTGIDPRINSITHCQLALNHKLISGMFMIFYRYISLLAMDYLWLMVIKPVDYQFYCWY